MMKFSMTFVASVLLAAVGGCDHSNANYCEGKLNNDCRSDGGVGPIRGCKAAPEKCVGATLVCDEVNDVCVECTTTNAAACVNVEPVCGADNSCRGCTAHSECTSEVCLPDGSCALASDVAYVDGTGGTDATNSMCEKAAPCKTVTMAVGTPKAIVKVKGVVNEATTIAFGGTTVKKLIGSTGAKIEGTNGTVNLIELRDTANVTVYDLTVGGNAGSHPASCVALVAGTPTLTVINGKIEACQNGLTVSGGTLTVNGTRLSANTAAGISASGGTVTLTGATVTGNSGGGVSITNSGFKLVNNFIFRNGNQDTSLKLSFSTAGTNVFAFNTVVDNRSQAGVTRAGGIICDVPTFTASNNIIARNQSGSSPPSATAQTLGDCVFGTTQIQNNVVGLNFAAPDAEPSDYHLLAGSIVIDMGTTPSDIVVDIDGDSRPQGANKDRGADEYKP